MITLEHIYKTFGTKEKKYNAVEDVSLHIEKGKIFGVIGFSGAGKSTLVRCINLLERPTAGKVYLQDTDLTALSKGQLRKQRRKIGMIFQQFQLFASRTVYQNIAFPLKHTGLGKKEVDAKVRELLALVDLEDKEMSYPAELSGGQKQRVAIARALATDPEVLLSDEATSALDPQSTKSILKLLKKVNEELGITIVVITHEMAVIKEICHQVVVMEAGQVVEQGDVFEIFSNPKAEITKNFVESTMNLARVYELIEEKSPVIQTSQNQCILRFKYLERTSSEALVSYLSRKYDLDINIIFGNIEVIGENPIGGLVSIVGGEPEKIQAAIEYLREIRVGVEVIEDANLSA